MDFSDGEYGPRYMNPVGLFQPLENVKTGQEQPSLKATIGTVNQSPLARFGLTLGKCSLQNFHEFIKIIRYNI